MKRDMFFKGQILIERSMPFTSNARCLVKTQLLLMINVLGSGSTIKPRPIESNWSNPNSSYMYIYIHMNEVYIYIVDLHMFTTTSILRKVYLPQHYKNSRL